MEIEYGKVVLTKEEYIALLHDARMLAYLSDNDALEYADHWVDTFEDKWENSDWRDHV